MKLAGKKLPLALAAALIACVLFVAWMSRSRKQTPACALAPAHVTNILFREKNRGRSHAHDEALSAQSQSPVPSLIEQVKSILSDWEADDDEALRSQRMEQLQTLLQNTNLFDVVQDLPPQLADYVFVLPLAHQQMLANPRAAADWMGAHTNIGDAHVQTLVHNWALQDKTAFEQYVSTLPEGDWKQKMLAAAGSDALSSNPADAISWARLMAPGEDRLSLLQMATTDWAKRDPDAAEQWLAQIGDESLQQQLARALAVGYAFDHPFQAANWLVHSLPPGPDLDHSVTEIVGLWAQKEPAAAGNWVSQFPDGSARQEALKNLLTAWTDIDSRGAEAWVNELPSGSLRNEAMNSLATISTETTPEN